jgi:hypothetical protein
VCLLRGEQDAGLGSHRPFSLSHAGSREPENLFCLCMSLSVRAPTPPLSGVEGVEPVSPSGSRAPAPRRPSGAGGSLAWVGQACACACERQAHHGCPVGGNILKPPARILAIASKAA